MIALVTGLKGSGKDTIGGWLHNQHGFKTMSFAEPLKDVVATMFGWDRKKLDGINVNDRVWRETKDEKWSQFLGRHITPRIVLQEMGTDVIRKSFHDDFWVLSAMSRINTVEKFCFTDTRFPNEITKIKEVFPFVFTINVIRPPLPKWYGSQTRATNQDIHSSEYTMTLYQHLFDHTVINDKGIPELCEQVEEIIKIEKSNRNKVGEL